MPLFLMFQAYYKDFLKKYETPKVITFTVLALGFLVTTIYMVGQQQDPRQRASEPTPSVSYCPTPSPCPAGKTQHRDASGGGSCPVYFCLEE